MLKKFFTFSPWKGVFIIPNTVQIRVKSEIETEFFRFEVDKDVHDGNKYHGLPLQVKMSKFLRLL